MNDNMDSTDKLLRDLALADSGWHRIEGPNGSAFFPETAKDIGEWEARSIEMHQAQETISLKAKPSDKSYRPTRLVSDLDDHSEPAKFEDSEQSRRLRGLSRGD